VISRWVALVLLGLVAAAARPLPFEITNNKPYVQVSIDGVGPQWFILDTGCPDASIIARECADRLKLGRGAEAKVEVGAGSGADVGLSRANQPVVLGALGDTLTVSDPRILTLGHVALYEGRRVDGLLGGDFMSRHVVVMDYAQRTITLHDPATYVPPPGAAVVPIELDTGWPIAVGTVTPRGGKHLRCRLIIDTGVRGVVTLFRPFSVEHGLHDVHGNRHDLATGGGAGGITRGDVGRLDTLRLGPLSFPGAIATFSRDTSGIFALDDPQGIVGGDLLRRHRVTFDYMHGRMVLEPYPEQKPFEYDMSGLFLAADTSELTAIRILSVHPRSPASEAGLRPDDQILAIDGKRAPQLTLDDARILFRAPGKRKLEIRRAGQVMQVSLEARRLI